MIGIIFKYGISQIHTVDPSDFVEALEHSMGEDWMLTLIKPAETFYNLCKTEIAKEQDTVLLLENIRYSMLSLWEIEIIQKSNCFKKFKLEPHN